MELHQIKMLCTAKETTIRIKRKPTEWVRCFPVICWMKNKCPEYIRSSNNKTSRE
jgi:hypothetical protein